MYTGRAARDYKAFMYIVTAKQFSKEQNAEVNFDVTLDVVAFH